jgi:hypothetical protein
MKIDQVLALIYLATGIVFGYISNYFNKVLGNLVLAFVIPIIFYLVSIVPLFRIVKNKKKNWLISNSLITFFIIWFIVWIIANNM